VVGDAPLMEPARYEWDERKRIENLEKHGIDFVTARSFDWTTAAILEDRRRDYGEPRFLAYGLVDGRVHVMVYTRRKDTRRIISFRKANRREQAAHAAGRPGR
jgi:uncharacterized protein